MDLRSALSLGGEQARSELTLLRKSLNHPGQKGTALENFIARLLKRHLPDHILATEGIIISSDGDVSNQIDLILYDSSAPKFFNNGTTRVIPVEYVYAIIEIKASLSASVLDDIFQKQRAVKAFKKYFATANSTPFLPVSFHAYGSDRSESPIFSFVFAFEASQSSTSILERYLAHHAQNHVSECIDMVYLGENDLIVRGSTGLGLDGGVGDCSTINLVQEDAMFYFISVITLLAIQWRMLQIPIIYKYFAGPAPRGKIFSTPSPNIENRAGGVSSPTI